MSEGVDDFERHERRLAELEFVSAAYDRETEAWHEVNPVTGDPIVYRRLALTSNLQIQLSLIMPPTYPTGEDALRISGTIIEEEGPSSSTPSHIIRKVALNALPTFLHTLQIVADENVGSETVFLIFSRADEWLTDGEWESFLQSTTLTTKLNETGTNAETNSPQSIHISFGRRLIYSHHIISKVKRADIKDLAAHHQLTGYMKIGWPGLLIIEGREDDCLAFYDTIRRWNWQYLVVRREERDDLVVPAMNEEKSLQDHRFFKSFLEVEDMSTVGQHCREVGLEAFFATSMKRYGNGAVDSSAGATTTETCTPYGALVHVDHMNDVKGYRKWLQKTATETGCQLRLKQTYPSDDYSKRPRIIVIIVGDSSTDVSNFLKRWRTSKVDVDSRGKACLERMMTVLVEDDLTHGFSLDDVMDLSWTMTEEELQSTLHTIGGDIWREAYTELQ